MAFHYFLENTPRAHLTSLFTNSPVQLWQTNPLAFQLTRVLVARTAKPDSFRMLDAPDHPGVIDPTAERDTMESHE
jgi:hypothetical protein